MELEAGEVTGRGAYPPQSEGPKVPNWAVLPSSDLPLFLLILLFPWPWSRWPLAATATRGAVCVYV